MWLRLLVSFVIVLLSISGGAIMTINAQATIRYTSKLISINLEGLRSLPVLVKSVKVPQINNPEWLQQQLDAERVAAELVAQQQAAARRITLAYSGTVAYNVATRGNIGVSLAEFKFLANQTLNDSRGWARLGISFQEVASGGSFTLVLSEAGQVPSFYPSICSSYWSCQVGNYVIINQDRWLGASDAWNQAGGSLRDYRHMVLNHETGHWLGHGDDNYHCGGKGLPAPVMQQQSISLLGCSFNPWPLNSELWSSRLGI